MSGYGAIKNELQIDEESSISKAERLRKISLARNGLTVVGTFIFIVGEMAGCGVLALPKALVNTGWVGLILLPVLAFNAGYSGVKLGKCWEIVEERYPEYRAHVRNPYPAIANVAIGPIASKIVTIAIRITLFGAGTVNLLLAAQIFQEIFGDFLPTITSCTYFLFMAVFVTPLMWFGSPKHFRSGQFPNEFSSIWLIFDKLMKKPLSFIDNRPVSKIDGSFEPPGDFKSTGIGAVLTTSAACILFFMQMINDAKDIERVHHTQFGFEEFFLGFGALLFAFGGASTFPTIQNDMKDKSKFGVSVIFAFIIIIILYFPIAIGGYFIFGDQVADNIAVSLGKSLYVEVGNILMGIHLIFAFLILINPVCQDLEQAFDIPKTFNWRRCVTRTVIIMGLIFVGETIPKFNKILSLIGGSSIAMLTFIFPPYLYMKLCDHVSDEWENRYIPTHERVYLWELIIVGVIGGMASTYSALQSIFGGSSLVKPCYTV